MKAHLLMPTSKTSGLRRLNSKRAPRAEGGIITCHLLDRLCQYAAANVNHPNTCTNWGTISRLYEDSWPDTPNTAKSWPFRTGYHSYIVIYMRTEQHVSLSQLWKWFSVHKVSLKFKRFFQSWASFSNPCAGLGNNTDCNTNCIPSIKK